MIARVWSAHVDRENLHIYLKHFSSYVLPELKKLDGFASAMILTRQINGENEILVTTFWTSMEAVDAFAGSDREAAVVTGEAAALLRSFDKRVSHYSVDVADSSECISIFVGRD